ncbi:uncharacterized protein LOC110106669 [Dendrobium catenatum]|uniref:uncharacterized protein LOC110106669 n=1 Tax=Dendrobium catenatum TaxID=906689 RepID=UPI0010A035A3|nr:uncharacterized protein LOC110106669 [Dendrobium catenatum]
MAEISEDFPPLSKGPVVGQHASATLAPWTDNFTAPETRSEVFPMTFVPPQQKLSFKADDLSEGISLWNLTLVGYSIGQRPYYERLLASMKKLWKLKGSMSLISLAEGFFLLKFNNLDDYNMIWSGGPWFLLGKPFVLQQWSPKFKPKRDENASILIWIKILDLPLALWTPSGISKIASYIGVPLIVDNLTAKRTRLSFARICVQISKDSKLPDEIPIEIEGEESVLKVIYDWKPTPCEICGSLIHPSLDLGNIPRQRGRSTSRNQRSKNRSNSNLPPILPTPPNIPLNPIPDNVPFTENITPAANAEETADHTMFCDKDNENRDTHIPNLNFPTEELSSSEPNTTAMLKNGSGITLANKFIMLDEENTRINNQEIELDEENTRINNQEIEIEEVSSINPEKLPLEDILSHNNSPPKVSPVTNKSLKQPPLPPQNNKSNKGKGAKKAKSSSSKSK